MGVGHALLVGLHTCQTVEKAQAASSQCDPRSHSTSTSILIQKITHTYNAHTLYIYLFIQSFLKAEFSKMKAYHGREFRKSYRVRVPKNLNTYSTYIQLQYESFDIKNVGIYSHKNIKTHTEQLTNCCSTQPTYILVHTYTYTYINSASINAPFFRPLS